MINLHRTYANHKRFNNKYAERGEQVTALRVYKASAITILQPAETIDEADLRVKFLTAEPVRFILERHGIA